MQTVALTGSDTIKILDRVLNDFADGTVAQITIPNELTAVKTGKNGNAIFAFNEMGKQAELQLRLIRGSSDDKYLNALLNTMRNDFSSFVLLTCEFVKNIGDGEGGITPDTGILTGGVFQKQPEMQDNVEGDTEQAVAIYALKFSGMVRSIG